MATNHTQNYQLNLWEPTDRFLRSEFNENFEDIEAALVGHDAALADLLNGKADKTAVTALSQTVAGKADAAALNAEAAARQAKDAALDAAVSAAQAKAEEEHFCMGYYVGDGAKTRTITLSCEPKFMLLISYMSSSSHVYFLTQSYLVPSGASDGSHEPYGPKLQGSKLLLRNETWGNNSGTTMWYILFR